MRPGQQNKRGRGRGSNNNGGGGGGGGNFNRKGANPLTRTYDSSGPDVKIRGTAQHIAEKYSNLARDAQSSGDRVIAENYLQHAEHYNRIIAAAQAQLQERAQRDDRNDNSERDMSDSDDNDSSDDQPTPVRAAPQPEIAGSGPQPVIEPKRSEQPAEEQQPVQADGADVPEKPRRRSASRPRRQPRRTSGAADETGAKSEGGSEQPVLADSE
ncbi:DUF4167 domain-containing protein [Agrobacterium sp. ES01]|uniref:DUF4167 domain-containing protein n=1 Tax=Agrobacterium sp. ES01 TaxID=3420714 RepID=UPI003D0FE8E6